MIIHVEFSLRELCLRKRRESSEEKNILHSQTADWQLLNVPACQWGGVAGGTDHVCVRERRAYNQQIWVTTWWEFFHSHTLSLSLPQCLRGWFQRDLSAVRMAFVKQPNILISNLSLVLIRHYVSFIFSWFKSVSYLLSYNFWSRYFFNVFYDLL